MVQVSSQWLIRQLPTVLPERGGAKGDDPLEAGVGQLVIGVTRQGVIEG